jgi:hypothetical protein
MLHVHRNYFINGLYAEERPVEISAGFVLVNKYCSAEFQTSKFHGMHPVVNLMIRYIKGQSTQQRF